jgi:selenide,water dikinase
MTDVTGYGLLGHLHELTLASGLAAELDAGTVPALPDVLSLLGRREPPIPGGTRRNRTWVEPHVNWARSVAEERRWLLCDAMTSGGLLIAATPGRRLPGICVGRLREGSAGSISVR